MKHFSKDYRVVAFDQRGYGLSSKPPFVSDYRIDLLAGDVADVIEQLGTT
jgi:pimeloyl-ACP methyl ester carboxylesterase